MLITPFFCSIEQVTRLHHCPYLVQDAFSKSLSDFLLKSQTPVEVLWSLRSIDLRVIALQPSFVNLRMPRNASLVPLTSKPQARREIFEDHGQNCELRPPTSGESRKFFDRLL